MEYATRDQAQAAVATLSNQNLMGRLVYVREVRHLAQELGHWFVMLTSTQDREAEPRFGPPGGAARGGFGGGMGPGMGPGGMGPGMGPGGMGGPYGGGGFNPGMAGGAGGGGRQIYISNVCHIHPPPHPVLDIMSGTIC